MIQITKHTSGICGCVTWYEWDDTTLEGSRVHTDIAVSPCAIHDPVNFGKTLLADTTSQESAGAIMRSTDKTVEAITDVRPDQVKDVIPLSVSLDARKEMYLQEETRAVLLSVPEISEDELDEKGNLVGRTFKPNVQVSFEFNEDRKLVVGLEGAEVLEKQVAETALNDSHLDTDLIIIS